MKIHLIQLLSAWDMYCAFQSQQFQIFNSMINSSSVHHFRMDLDAIDILESGHLDLDDDVGDLVDGVQEQESTTPIDELKELVERNLSFLGLPGQVDPSPLTMVSLKEKYPQVSVLVFDSQQFMFSLCEVVVRLSQQLRNVQ